MAVSDDLTAARNRRNQMINKRTTFQGQIELLTASIEAANDEIKRLQVLEALALENAPQRVPNNLQAWLLARPFPQLTLDFNLIFMIISRVEFNDKDMTQSQVEILLYITDAKNPLLTFQLIYADLLGILYP